MPTEVQPEKQAKLQDLRTRLQQGAADEAAFQSLYLAIDDVRMWLWKNAAERPVLAQGTFEETADAWRVTTPELDVRIQRAGLGWKYVPVPHRGDSCPRPTMTSPLRAVLHRWRALSALPRRHS